MTVEEIRDLVVKPLLERQLQIEQRLEQHADKSNATAAQIARIEAKLNNGITEKLTSTNEKVELLYNQYNLNKTLEKKKSKWADFIKTIVAAIVGALSSKLF